MKLKRVFYSVTVFLFALLIPISSCLSAYALDLERLKFYAANNIIYFDPTNSCTDIVSSKPSGSQITWIGDSYTVGATNIIQAKLPGVDIHAQSSKHFGLHSDGNDSGIEILRQMVSNNESIREYLVFALGTNDQSDANIVSYIDEIESIIGSNRTMILVTPRIYNATYERVIQQMHEAADKYSNIIIADWAGTVENKLDTAFTPDKDTIHPNTTGYDLWVETIYAALPGGVTLLSGSTNEEKIWNYFVTANIPGVSDNAAVIAGILGNLFQESGYNPFAHTDGTSFYGIYQTLESGLLDAMDQAGLGGYWGSSDVSQDKQDLALQIQLDWLTQHNERWLGTGWAKGFGFITHLESVSQKTPEAYAELFEMSVEGAVTDNTAEINALQDSGVISLGTANFGAAKGGGRYYQHVGKRRNNARKTYDMYVNYSSPIVSVSNSSSANGTGAQWTDDGWLVPGSIPGAVKEDANTRALRETPRDAYSTGTPNKILLHSTEGQQNGLNAYGTNLFPAHFTIDLKNKTVAQHFSIWKPSLALAGGDVDGPIQIEIVGFSTEDRASSPYYLHNYTSEEWDYLAVLLAAISEQTGIPLTSSVDWARPATRLSSEDFKNYTGIIGHEHAPLPNSHVDPGDIWQYVEAAIKRNPSASKFATGSNATSCSKSATGLVSGGLTLEQAKDLMKEFYELAVEYSGTRRLSGQTITHTFSDGASVRLYHSGCVESDLANCSTFSQYFINRFTTADVTAWNGGVFVSRLLELDVGFIDGGTTPKAYAIFSIASGSTMCDGSPCGHTGVVLGIDESRGKIIIGEAGCGSGLDWIGAKEKDLSQFTNGSYHYAYTDAILKNGAI